MVVYLCATFDERIGLVTFFLDIIELSSTTAEGTETALLDCLARHGLPVDYLGITGLAWELMALP